MIIDKLHKLLKQNGHFYLADQQIDALGSEKYVDIVLDNHHVENESLSFKNVTFLQKVELSKFKLKGILSFSNCIFSNGINLTCVQSDSLIFHNCSFQGNNSIKISQHCVFGGISEIASCGKLRSLVIMNTKFSHLIISHCEIDYQYFMRHNEFALDLQLEKNIFSCQIRQESNSFGSFVLSGNVFKRDLFFKDKALIHSLSITGNNCEEEIVFDPYDSIGEDSQLTLLDNIFRRSVKFVNYQLGGCKKIYIGSNIFGSGLSISGKNKYDETYIKQIDLVLSNNNEGLIKINNVDVNTLKICGENYKGNIIFRAIQCEDFNLESFANYSNFQFINLRPFSEEAKFRIIESHLEKVLFVNSDLDTFKTYNIRHSNFSLVRSANTKWFNYTQLSQDLTTINQELKTAKKGYKSILTEQREIACLEIREVFRQLKYAMDQQGDRFESLKFRSFEMEAYYKYLQTAKKRWNIDRLILFLGKSNDHGINWIRPLIILFFCTLMFYILIFYAASPRYVFGHGQLDITNFLNDLWDFKKIIPQMFNPTHQVEKLFPDNYTFSGFLMTFDLMYKIVFSYLVFQTISAFRKFVK